MDPVTEVKIDDDNQAVSSSMNNLSLTDETSLDTAQPSDVDTLDFHTAVKTVEKSDPIPPDSSSEDENEFYDVADTVE
jgi:hypothetical protein